MTTKYDLENLLKENFPFKISSIERSYPNIKVKINDLNIVFRNYEEYNFFGYYLKRQLDLGTIKPKTDKYETEDLKEYLVFDSGFNLIGNFSYEEKTKNQLDDKLFFFEHYGDKCFWGTVLEDGKLQIMIDDKTPYITDYVPQSTDSHNTKVMIQPGDLKYDEAFFVYINSMHKPDKLIDIAYIFTRYGDEFLFDYAYKNNWIY
jgi:hypothetical protein